MSDFSQVRDLIREAIGWLYPILLFALILLALLWPRLKARLWLVAAFALQFMVMLGWRVPEVFRLMKAHELAGRYYEIMAIPLNLLGLVPLFLFAAYIVAAGWRRE